MTRAVFNLPFTKWKGPCASVRPDHLGEGPLTSLNRLRRRATLVVALTVALAGTQFATRARAAGAFAIGKCGAYGEAYDYAGVAGARAAALKQCKGECTAVTMKRACAALSIDMANPCGPHGYAVEPRISSSLNEATRKCYEYGGKECVIRAWACDARG